MCKPCTLNQSVLGEGLLPHEPCVDLLNFIPAINQCFCGLHFSAHLSLGHQALSGQNLLNLVLKLSVPST